jgi:hypothetical protein
MELTNGDFKHKVLCACSCLKPVEAYSHNQNLAASAIRDFHCMFHKAMRATNAPYILWDHCMALMTELRSNTALDLRTL